MKISSLIILGLVVQVHAQAAKPVFCKNIASIALRDNKVASSFGETVNDDFSIKYDEGLEPYEPKQSENFDNIQNYDAGRAASYTIKQKKIDNFSIQVNAKFGEKSESSIVVNDARNVRESHDAMVPDVYNYTVNLDHTCRIKDISFTRIFDGDSTTETLNGVTCKGGIEDINKNLRAFADRVCKLYNGYFAAYINGKLIGPGGSANASNAKWEADNAKISDAPKRAAPGSGSAAPSTKDSTKHEASHVKSKKSK